MNKTKREYFNELKNYVTDNTELTAFINHEIELLAKKNSAPKKPTANQLENEKIKDVILANLNTPMTVSDIMDQILAPNGYEVSNQRVTAIMNQLKEDNSVVREVKKRKPFYSLAV